MPSSRFAIAVHTLALMANIKDKPLKSEYIACLVKTNPVVIRRLLCELSRADLIESQSGASGGSWLKKDAEDISLSDVYCAVESGEVFSLHKPDAESHCAISSNICDVLTGIQDKVDSAIEHSLGEIKLSDVLRMLIKEPLDEESCRNLNK